MKLNNGIVLCHDEGTDLAPHGGKWEVDKPATFQWMPGGVTTMTPSYDGRRIRLTVACDANTAKIVQASYDEWKKKSSQKPFGCVEHREQEASIWPESFEWRTEPNPGVFCTGLPTELGAHNVNGRIHRSWSPSFTTNAEYDKCICVDCKTNIVQCSCGAGQLEFPKGVRGSVTNPARVTGVAFSVGSLTNKPAFRNILPVRCKAESMVLEMEGEELEIELDVPILAAGTSEGVKKSWEHRTRAQAQDHLRELRKGGYKGRASIKSDPRSGTFYVQKEEGELAPKKQSEKRQLTPYDKDIRRMKKFGTQDMHGALADIIYSDQQAREEYEGDFPGGSWEDAAGDLASNYLEIHGIGRSGIRNDAVTLGKGIRNDAHNASDEMDEEETIRAGGTSEGARKGWEHRLRLHTEAHEASKDAISFYDRNGFHPGEADAWSKAARLHRQAAAAYKEAARDKSSNFLEQKEAEGIATTHENLASHHESVVAGLRDGSIKNKASDESMSKETIRATRIKQHQSTSKTGKVFTVQEHEDSRKKKVAEVMAKMAMTAGEEAHASSRKAHESAGSPSHHRAASVAHEVAVDLHTKAADAAKEAGMEKAAEGHANAAKDHGIRQKFHDDAVNKKAQGWPSEEHTAKATMATEEAGKKSAKAFASFDNMEHEAAETAHISAAKAHQTAADACRKEGDMHTAGEHEASHKMHMKMANAHIEYTQDVEKNYRDLQKKEESAKMESPYNDFANAFNEWHGMDAPVTKDQVFGLVDVLAQGDDEVFGHFFDTGPGGQKSGHHMSPRALLEVGDALKDAGSDLSAKHVDSMHWAMSMDPGLKKKLRDHVGGLYRQRRDEDGLTASDKTLTTTDAILARETEKKKASFAGKTQLTSDDILAKVAMQR